MALADFLALGNSAKGAYDAQMQAIVNAQNQQRINDMLANDALKRHLMQQQVTGGGMGLMALGSTPTAQPPAPVASPVAPAPAPGQNSARQPGPVAVPSPVPMPGAMQQQPLPPMPAQSLASQWQILPQVQAGRDREAVNLMQQELQRQQAALANATPAQAQQIQGNIAALHRQIASMSQGAARAGAAPPAPVATPGARAPAHSNADGVGRALALINNNMPLNLLSQQVARFKQMYPNATPDQLYYGMAAVSPQLAEQVRAATSAANLTMDSFFKAADLKVQQQGLALRQQLIPSQIASYNARAKYEGAMSNLFGAGGQGSGLQSPIFQANLAIFQKYHPGAQPSRYMLGVMMSTPPSDFRANMLAGQSQGAGVRAVSGALGKATTTASMLEANYTAFDNQMKLVQQLQQKVPSLTNSPWMNQKILNYKVNLAGDPQAKAYVQAMLAAAGEYAKIIRGGGSQVTNHARELADQALNKSITPAQLQELLPVLAKESQNIIGGWKDQVAQLSGQLRQPTINAPAASATPAPSTPAVPAQQKAPQAAVDYLKAHPDLAPQFKAKYGYLPPGM